MAEQNQDMQAISQVLSSVMAQMKQMNTASPAPATPSAGIIPGMPAPAQSSSSGGLTGWSVPVEQEIDGMVVTLYLNFPAETFAQAPNMIMTLVNQGYQVRAYQKKDGWGSRGGGYGGYNRGRYGYGRR